jgi:hypothetical protein
MPEKDGRNRWLGEHGQQIADGAIHMTDATHAGVQLREHHQLHQLLQRHAVAAQRVKLVENAGFPAEHHVAVDVLHAERDDVGL